MKLPHLKLPDHLRVDYSNPWGLVVTGSLGSSLSGVKGVVCVGDIVSRYCLELLDQVDSMILVYDMRTRRFRDVGELRVGGFSRYTVVNERGTVSLEVYKLLCDLISTGGVRAAVEVVGEEDMIALPAISCIREGWAVVYGIPDRGACIVRYSGVNVRIAQTRFLQLKPGVSGVDYSPRNTFKSPPLGS